MNQEVIDRERALETLRRHKDEFEERYGVTRIGIFGSVARDEVKDESDIDVVVEMAKPDLFYMVHIKEILEKDFQRPVDIVHLRDKMNLVLKERINREAIYV
ncbi:MAG: nucleotidyltransferase [Firmicutes bacterium]|nr:nucleotidyltransferase [Bacillota bacterium]